MIAGRRGLAARHGPARLVLRGAGGACAVTRGAGHVTGADLGPAERAAGQ